MNCINITSNSVIMLIDGKRYAQDTYANLQKLEDPKIHEFFSTI
jgi:phospholipid/cholesterol/gamma-HCH transport system ATP-binding protein